jgi:Na+/phosphate symporter
VHKALIHLLDHLSWKYFRQFKLSDEGQYWETRSEKLLDDNFKHLNACMESLNSALETRTVNEGEKFEHYFKRLLQRIHKSKKENDGLPEMT